MLIKLRLTEKSQKIKQRLGRINQANFPFAFRSHFSSEKRALRDLTNCEGAHILSRHKLKIRETLHG